MKLNKKYEYILFTFLMAFGMSCIISFFNCVINVGFHEVFLEKWLAAWRNSFVIAFPAAYILPKGIRKLMKKVRFV
ncbi:DUF2798 domain-containing protein [Paenibacillus sp. PR3]|uniref:DUF2798 domain-containing protein n=1 Tax=Paenibacillus terricola TaxID=2763503 RepID=A0ABR8MUT5_9BACL|nr:DUF2798 domain-containing protein [Paenibacillus terricola]MBD3919733.1 DUF2798 domain-containing protein [Paenibacillus terricola]